MRVSCSPSSTQEDDLFGEKLDAILVCDGVTGTELAQNKILWFYNGKPLNNGHISVCITVTQDQFTMSSRANGSPKDSFVIHGDTRISKLGKAQIGNVKGKKFYLNLPSQERRGGFRGRIGDLAIAFRARNIFSSSIGFATLCGIRVDRVTRPRVTRTS